MPRATGDRNRSRVARSARRACCLAAVVLALDGCGARSEPARVIACVGDSITEGIVVPFVRDREGGFPRRLQRRLGQDVRVLNNGVGGATAARWLLDPRSEEGARTWTAFRSVMPDPPADRTLAGARTIVSGVLGAERPDLVVVLLGINDLWEGRRQGAGIVDLVAGRIDAVRREAATVAPTVLVATLLPNERDPADLREQINARIRTAHPDFLPLAERFAAAGWRRLLGDDIHPSAEGHELLATILAEELVSRGYAEGVGRGH